MKRIMFIKDYVDVGTFGFPFLIEITSTGTLLDAVDGKIEVDEGGIVEGVEPNFYCELARSS